MMDITPRTHLLKSLRRRGLTHADAFAELIDNSLDAKATRIGIDMTRPRIVATDNGRGVTRASVQAMLTLGEHGRGNDAGLGIYGVGFNLAAINLADEVEIAGIHRGEVIRAAVNWGELFRRGEWAAPDPVVDDATDDDRGQLRIADSGTRIQLSKLLSKQPPSGQNFDIMCDRLRFMFTPALRAGKQITIKPPSGAERILAAVELPPFDVSVDVTVGIAEGRTARIRCGVVKDGARNDFRGFAVAFRHRYIQRSAVFCGEAPSTRIAGEIVLIDDAWHGDLADTKSALVRHHDDLADAVQAACAEVFKAAAGQARMLQISALTAQAEAIVRGAEEAARSMARDSKAKRKPRQNESGAVVPVGRGPKHERAERTQRGETFAGRVGRALRIQVASLGPSTIGETDLAAARVTLNGDHEHVRRMLAANDSRGMAAAAVFLLAHEQDSTGQRVFSFSSDSYPELVGRVLNGCKGLDERELEAAS